MSIYIYIYTRCISENCKRIITSAFFTRHACARASEGPPTINSILLTGSAASTPSDQALHSLPNSLSHVQHMIKLVRRRAARGRRPNNSIGSARLHRCSTHLPHPLEQRPGSTPVQYTDAPGQCTKQLGRVLQLGRNRRKKQSFHSRWQLRRRTCSRRRAALVLFLGRESQGFGNEPGDFLGTHQLADSVRDVIQLNLYQ